MNKYIKWLRFAGTIVMALTGGALLVVGQNGQVALLIVGGLGMFIAAVYLAIKVRPWKSNEYSPAKKADGVTTENGKVSPPNTLLITKEKIEFVHEENPTGIPRTYRNDSKAYYVKKDDKTLVLPDGIIYFDTKEYGNVLTMGAHKLLFMIRNTVLQYVATGMMVVAIIVVGIILIIFGSPAPA